MKTATFEYTDKTDVDSSLAQAVYYNSGNQTMAIEFHDEFSRTGSAIYGQVPEAFYRGFVTLDSIGKTYNSYIKKTFPNLSEGTVYDVDYVDMNSKVAEEENYTYKVNGYIRHTGVFSAKNRDEARQKFLDSLSDEGYDEEDMAVTEVVIIG